MRRIIVNADDFGRHPLINQAVAQAVETGFLRSATLMPGGKAFDGAVEVARTHKELGIGVHFTLVNGFPVLPPEEIPSLVTTEGVFYDTHNIFVKRFLTGKVSMDEVRRELAAQMEKMMRTGLTLTHIDSHQHMHTLPGIIDAALDVAYKAGIRAARVPVIDLFCGDEMSPGQLIGRLGLGTLARIARHKAHKRGMKMPDTFAGIVAGEAVSEKYLREMTESMPEGTTEVMLHPGTDNHVLVPACEWNHDFEEELRAVTSKATMQLLKDRNIEIGNFRDLYDLENVNS